MAATATRNVVLICLDSVRNDFFEEAAPRTQALADVSFDQCRAASSWSVPSQASMVTGLLPHEHGVHTYSPTYDDLPVERTVLDAFEDHRTVGISANVYAGPSFGFDRYFDEFHSLIRQTRFPEAATAEEFLATYDGDSPYLDFLRYCLDDEHTLKSLCNGTVEFAYQSVPVDLWRPLFDEGAGPGLRLARRELAASDEPTFVYMNLMEGHVPYRPATYLDGDLYDCPWTWSSGDRGSWELRLGAYDEEYWERRNQLYRANIDYLDRRLADFIDEIGDDTTVVVTADHGDDLGTEVDEGLVNHKSSLTEGVLHVPLHVVNAPSEQEPQTSRYVSHLQLPELLVGLRDGHVPDVTRDRIAAEVMGMGGGSDPPPDVDDDFWDRTIRCAYRDDEKVRWDSSGEVVRYEVSADRSNWQRRTGELESVPGWATESFQDPLDVARQRATDGPSDGTAAVEVDERTERRLRELGYL